MSFETALSIREEQTVFDDKQIAALKQIGLNNISNADLAVFFHQAKKTGLDPFSRQIYGIVRGGKFGIQASIDGLRVVAQRTGLYAGQLGPYWCGDDGVWVDAWLSSTPPKAAKVGIIRKDFNEPLWAVARWESYAQNSPTWRSMGDLMLAKCAEANALRRGFPQDLSGIYTAEEMEQVDKNERVSKPINVKAITNDDFTTHIEATPINEKQIQQIHILKDELALDDESYQNTLKGYYKVITSKDLTYHQATDIIKKMKDAVKKRRFDNPIKDAIKVAAAEENTNEEGWDD